MPLHNRVQPDGTIIANPARGMFMGNRGILHDNNQTLGVSRWRHPHWVTCRLDFKGRKRPLMTPHNYTELFFLDEAVALSAGHRPCAECRRVEYLHFRICWDRAFGADASLADIDKQMHKSRVAPGARQQRSHVHPIDDIPDGTFILWNAQPHLIWGEAVLPYTPAGYGADQPRPASGQVAVLTPAVTVAVLRAGYVPAIHPSARAAGLPAHRNQAVP